METQWYCPPEVGAIEAISDRVVKTERVPIQTTMNPYIIPEGPPLQGAVIISKMMPLESWGLLTSEALRERGYSSVSYISNN